MSKAMLLQRRHLLFLLATMLLFSLTWLQLDTLTQGFIRQNYVVLHLSIELLTIFVFTSCVVIVLQPLHQLRHSYTNTVIFGFTIVALLDYVHAVSYEGMPMLLSPASTAKSIFFWLAARAAELVVFALIAARLQLPGRKICWAVAGGGLALLVIWLGTRYLYLFPVTFVAGVGVTAVKTAAEYGLFLGNLLLAGWFFFSYVKSRETQQLLLAASAWCMALCALSLTDYVAASDLTLLVGHTLKFVSALLIYKGIFWTELKNPYQRLRAAEELAVHNEQKLETMLGNLPVGVMRLDLQLNFQYLNRALREMSPSLQGQVFGHHLSTHSPAAVWQIYQSQLGDVVSGHSAEFAYSLTEGEQCFHRIVKAVPESGKQGETESVLCLVSDVSAQVAAEQQKMLALQETAQLKAALDEHAIVAFTDAKGVITSVNDKFCQISGYARQELLGQTHRLINSGWHDADFFRQMWKSLKSGQIWHGEVCNRAKNGALYWVNTTIVPFVNDAGVVEQYIAIRADITERKLAELEARRLALYDDLTGLPNRRFLKDQISQLCQSEPAPVTHALMLLDLDNFKDINDSFGHPTGDELLQQVAHRLQRFAQTGDYCARLGGDEFVLLLPHLGDNSSTASAHLMELAEKLRTQLAEPYRLNGKVVRTTASVGISLFVAGPDDSANALKQADIALYQSKANGRNCSTFFDPELQKAMDQRNQILRELKTALEHQELQLFYQPIFDAQQHMTGVEALLRWHSPVLGFVSPAVFIPLAEESNLILDIGGWVLQTACQQIAQWQAHPVRQHWIVAVNVSARQLRRANFVDTVTALVRQSQIPAACLQLEVTESMLQHDIDDTMQTLSTLKAMGVRFSLDDFGTGYSSLNYLTKLPIHTLKIDRSFVDRMLQSHEDASVVQTILALAKGLGLDVVAEGVETVEQFRFLQHAGCQKFQGYLLARPMPPAALPEGAALPADTAAQLAKC